MIKNYHSRFITMRNLLLFLSLSWAFGCQGNTSTENTTKNWLLLFIQKGHSIQLYNPTTQKILTHDLKHKPKGYKGKAYQAEVFAECYSANHVIKAVLCKVIGKPKFSLINYMTQEIIKVNIEVKGPFSGDGKYILDSDGRGIYDINNNKYIRTKGKWFPEKRLITNNGNTIEVLTAPKADGRFICTAVEPVMERGMRSPSGPYVCNLQDIIKKGGNNIILKPLKGAFDLKEFYIGNNKYLVTTYLTKQPKNTTPTIIQKNKLHPNLPGSCYTTTDGTLGLCDLKGNNNSRRPIIFNTMNMHSQYIPGLTPPYIALWVWVGDAHKNPGYIDF